MHFFGDDQVIVGKNIKGIGGNKVIFFEKLSPKVSLWMIPFGEKDDDNAGIFDDAITLFEEREFLVIGNIAADKEIVIHFCLDGVARLIEVDVFDFDKVAVSIFES